MAKTENSIYEGRIYTTVKGQKIKVLSVKDKKATIMYLKSGVKGTAWIQNLSLDTTQPVSVSSPYDKRKDGTFIGSMSNKTIPSTDTDLYRKWRKLMDYAKKESLPVDDELKEYAKFLQLAKDIFNYEEWMLDETYRLYVRKGATKVSLNTILFISEETWQNEYKEKTGQEAKPVMAYIELDNGTVLKAKFNSQVECAKSLGVHPDAIATAKSRQHTVGGGVGSGKGWRIVDLEEDDEFLKE